jgi:hypothetical protein
MTTEPEGSVRRGFQTGLLAVCLVVAAPGCSERPDRAEQELGPSPESTELHSPGLPDSLPSTTISVEEVLRLGELDGDGPAVFGEIRAVAVTRDRDILVFDHFGNELRRFDENGMFLYSLGGTGEGPAEFLSVLAIAVSDEDDIWIVDGRNSRYSIVRDSAIVNTVPRASRVVTRPWIGGFDRAGQMHDFATRLATEGVAHTEMIVRVADDGTTRSEHTLPRDSIPTPTLGQGVMLPVPFQARLLRAWDPAGAVWQALSSEYHIVRIDLSGDTTHVWFGDERGPTLNASERDSLDTVSAAAERQFGIEVSDEMRPERIPILRWLSVDDTGQLWVCATGRDPCDSLHVHDPETGRRTVVDLPVPLADLPVPVIRNGMIHGVTQGPMGEPQIFVGRVY